MKCDDYDIFEHLRFILFSRNEVSNVQNLKLFTSMTFENPCDHITFSERFRRHVLFIDSHLKYCLPTKKDVYDCESLIRLKCDKIEGTCENIRDFYQNEMKYDENLTNYRKKSFFKGLLTFIYNWESLNLFPYYVSLLPIPVNKILSYKYKLKICTEFAKLTSAILYQIYPDSEVFLFFTTDHVATGLLATNDFLIIDQERLFNLVDWIQEQQKKETYCVSVYFVNTESEETKLEFQTWINVKNGKLIHSSDLLTWKEYYNYERSNLRKKETSKTI